MADKCENCTEKCPRAEMAHQAALGRMYATKEFIALLKKVESGELVEVVRCKDCKHYKENDKRCDHPCLFFELECYDHWIDMGPNDFCSYGERRNDENP